MARYAAVRFWAPALEKRQPVRWFNPQDKVPDDVAAMVDERCLMPEGETAGGDDGEDLGSEMAAAGKGVDDISGWILSAEDDDTRRARAEFALEAEQKASKPRSSLIEFAQSHLGA